MIAPPVTYASRGESGPAGGGGGPMRITRGEFGFSLRSARIETRPVAIIATCRSRVQLNGTRVERVRDTRIVVHAISVRKSVPFRSVHRIGSISFRRPIISSRRGGEGGVKTSEQWNEQCVDLGEDTCPPSKVLRAPAALE